MTNNIQSANAIVVDANDNAYVAGSTYSNSFPTSEFLTQGACVETKNLWRRTRGRLRSKNRLKRKTGLWISTYLGGASDDEADGIAVDTSGRAYVTG